MSREVFSQANLPPSSPTVFPEGTGRTVQSEKDACDINKLMARYEKTGVLPTVNRSMFFADISEVGDYRDIVDRIDRIQETFMQLPPEVRSRFENQPAEFLDFCSDESNREELVQLGLIETVDAVDDVPEPPKAPEVPGEPSAEPPAS